MRVEFDQILCNLAGIPLNSEGKPLTLKMVAINALLANYPDETISGGEKFARYALSRRIYKGNYEFRAEEVTKLKTLIGKYFEAVVVGPAYTALDGEEQCKPVETHEDIDLQPPMPVDEHELGVPA